MLLAGTDLEDYKRGLPPPLTTHTISYVKEKSREAPPLCIISLGSVWKEYGEEPDLSASLRLCTSTNTVLLEYIFGFFYSVSSSEVILLFSFVREFIVYSHSGYSRRGPLIKMG